LPGRTRPASEIAGVTAALAAVLGDAGGPPVHAAGFAALVRTARERVIPLTTETVLAVHPVIGTSRALQERLTVMRGLPADVGADVRGQLAGLVHPGFVADTGIRRLAELPRYLRGISHRLDRLGGNVERDALAMRRVHAVAAEYRQLAAQHPGDPAVAAIRWMRRAAGKPVRPAGGDRRSGVGTTDLPGHGRTDRLN